MPYRSVLSLLTSLFCVALIFGNSAFCQKITIPILTKNNALVLEVQNNKDVSFIYYGEKLADQSEYALVQRNYHQAEDYTGLLSSVYTPSGSRNLFEPAITVTHADGNNSLDLRYVSHKFENVDNDVSLLSIVLKDPVYAFEVTLYFKSFYQQDVIEQWSNIRHQEKGDVVLHKYASANLHMVAKNFYLKQYHGDWAKEMQPEETRLTHGIKTLDSKLGTRADIFQPSVFMVSLNDPATEQQGTVLMGAMEYSGNFKIDMELDNQDNLRILAGINNYASPYTLKPNEDFTTPAFLYTLSTTGRGTGARNLQSWARNYKLLNGKGERLTLLNNWESTFFNFDEAKLAEILKDTKKLGVDLFLLDDGWFGNKYPRNNDKTALGDWQENQTKLPNGIAALVKEAASNGVKFGIWLEPEMVSPKSELYEKHPDWVIKQPKREEYYYRNQLVLDLANPQVQDFVFKTVDDLFTKNPELAYIKWDCNAVIYNAYSSYLKNQSHFYIEYMRGLYSVLKRVRAKYPTVPMMLCSGGGARVDYAALQYFTEFWPSDNTDPLERIYMQWEYSYFYPAIAVANHVTDWGKQPIKYRTNVAMMGKLGFDIVVSRLNEKELQYVQSAVKLYDSFKSIVWHGDQYRLIDPYNNSVASTMFVDSSKTKAIMFSYLVSNRYRQGSKLPILLQGLDAGKKYFVKEVDVYPGAKAGIAEGVYTGDFLMKVGFNPNVNESRTSVVLSVEER